MTRLLPAWIKKVAVGLLLFTLACGCDRNSEFISFESRCIAKGGDVFLKWANRNDNIYSWRCLMEVPDTWPREYRDNGTFLVTIGLP